MNPIHASQSPTLTIGRSGFRCFLFATLVILSISAVVITSMAIRSTHGCSLPKIFDGNWIKNLGVALGKKGSIALLISEIVVGAGLIFYCSRPNAIKCSIKTKSIPFPEQPDAITLAHFFVNKTGDRNEEYFSEFLRPNEAIGLYFNDDIPKITFFWKTADGELKTSLCALSAKQNDAISLLASYPKKHVTHLIIPIS